MFIDRAELEPRSVFICDYCGQTIYEGDYAYHLNDGDTVICEDCIAKCRREAVYEAD